MNRCRLCVVPDTRPDTAFEDGICSACRAYAARPSIDWDERERMLTELLARARSSAKARRLPYDCVVPSSGGKDSTYQVLELIRRGARPLVVTATTCHLTPIGRANIDNLARYASTIEYTPNRAVRAKLNRLGLTMVGDVSWPEHAAIFTIPWLVAARAGIPFIFYGENPQNQYGSPTPEHEAAMQMTARWRSEFGGFLGMRPEDFVGVDGLTEEDMADYMLRPTIGIEAHFLGQYIPWDSHRNAEVAKAAGMRQALPCSANWWEHENLDNAQTGLHDHLMYRKYGYGRGCMQLAVDVRTGRIERGRALEIVENIDGAFPWTYGGVDFREVLERIEVSPIALLDLMRNFTNWDLFDGEPAGTWRPTLA